MKSQLKVSLINFTPQPEKTIAAAAKLCYSRVGVEEIDRNLTPENVEKFLKILMDMGHESPIEHVSFTFGVEGVSRAMSHQLVRHRVGCSYSQQSQRYVKLEQFDYIIPPSIEAIPEARQRFIQAMEQAQVEYDFLVELLLDRHTKALLKNGMKEEQARRAAEKMSIEDARYIFPNACETKVVFTMNARALYHFFHQRCCERAQWEIRQLATEMLKRVRQISPVLFAKAGPPCLKGACPEKQMTCGSGEEVRKKFQNL
ncbi:FAD-dependent thymidylate synthase [Candidatus Contubernalis alkaliaceticus]|uniref:FAD-dependent thymidylate synthase n=1 Tax=Candidatus Contubernalis alkaliaceticus TaxID=338645 RepID=UPI001F4BEEF5|nr:FAD-dependent thymidylate synthase [Candidatus Contubernalis alkalaceticus]UNC93345.1 FAD-dependent thymidylate synthase [Candidatus Contubernalis alkalaceticus]